MKHICRVSQGVMEGGGAYSIIQNKTGTPEDVLPRCFITGYLSRHTFSFYHNSL